MAKHPCMQLFLIYMWLKFCGDPTTRSGENRKNPAEKSTFDEKIAFLFGGKMIGDLRQRNGSFKRKVL